MKMSLTLLSCLLLVAALPALGALTAGTAAPDVSATGTDGKPVKLSDFHGKWVVLFFYPKADTPGCTTESCSLRDGHAEIGALNAVVLGASLDDVDAQQAFKGKYNLPYTLLADKDKTVAKAFDVLATGGLFAQRKTFLINPQGTIAYVFDTVNVGSHAADVTAKLKELQAAEAK